MPLPSQIHIDKLLTGVIIGASNESYVAGDVLPVLNPPNLSGKVAKLNRDHYRVTFVARASGQPAYRVDWSATTVTYNAEEFSAEFPVDDQEKANYDDPFDAMREGAFLVNELVWGKVEDLVASLLTTSGNFPASNLDTTDREWDDDVSATSTPVADVRRGIKTIVDAHGTAPNSLHGVCGYNVFNNLVQHADVKEAWLNTTPGASASDNMDAAKVATALGLQTLQVGTAVKDTNKEGATTVTAPIWGTANFLVYYRTPRIAPIRANLGYIIAPRVQGFPGGATVAVDRYREEKIKSDVVRATALIDEIIANNTFGFLFTQTQ